MGMEVFERLERSFGGFRFVHLAGFGEPLMNRALPEMIRRIKRAGCHASFTTNGILLGEKIGKEVLDSGVDAINVSIDASTAETYEETRGRGLFLKLMMNIRDFKEMMEERGLDVYMQWIFLMMKSTISELADAVELAAELGFQKVVAKHMETGVSRENLREALFNTGVVEDLDEETEREFGYKTMEAEERAKRCGIELLVHPRRYRVGQACLALPLDTIYVDYAGSVSSCCYLSVLDVRPYMEEHPESNGVIGNINEAPLEELMIGSEYRKFIKSWEKGKAPEACRGCMQLVRMNYKEG
jgi:MoaA/NifB/PqqE/SkfB family radical SAM enzyme